MALSVPRELGYTAGIPRALLCLIPSRASVRAKRTAGGTTGRAGPAPRTAGWSAMTGKLADKLPLTMSTLINTIPDSLYPEEDIPTSMNIFTSTDSINHYSQMNTGKNFTFTYCFVHV